MEVVERLRSKAREAREDFVSKRAILEREVTQFSENIKLVDPELISHIEIPEGGITTRTLFPSLYKEPLSVEEYELEQKNFASLLSQFDVVRNGLIAKAEELMNGQSIS